MFSLRIKIFLLLAYALLSPSWSANPRKVKKTYKIRDKIFLITHPLMKSARLDKKIVSFSWSEPHHDFKYFLEIYREGENKPISSIPVSNGIKKIKFSKKEKKKLYWRVIARSNYGNRTKNKKLYLVPLKY